MAFLQPVMFWGALAVVIPIVIHFWYQKKGKTINWAATQWLTDKTNLQHRGIRLDEIPLMLIRCLLVILLASLLARPIGNWLGRSDTQTVAHVVEANRSLVSNYRFELEAALKKGEKVFWISPETEELKDISALPPATDETFSLQKTILQAAKYGSEIHIYFNNQANLAQLPKVIVPASFKLFTATDSTKQTAFSYIQGEDQKRVFTDNKTGLLTVNTEKNNLASESVNKGQIRVLVDYKNAGERQTVQAALLALEDIYSLPIAIDIEKNNETDYNWILTDKPILNPAPGVLYTTSGFASDGILPANVFEIPDSLRLATSDLVRNGRLPELLGDALVQFYGLKKNDGQLSDAQLHALFVQSENEEIQSSDMLYQLLLLAFVLTLLAERWIALSKNVTQNYA